ncbi:polymer-forming cytoskeletal protein [Escherichia sp. E5028]|uniref:bactofilin family protein n=1 Tax=Escherichia sp. E5028 TaxID=2044602 RepID=UPI001436BE6C|nr:polymer-forming cytoskeletal protein [Escherichia sp. E5028]
MMFNKSKAAKDKLEILSTPESVVDVGSTVKKMENRNSANETGTDSTVIASDVVFDGNINSNKQIYIYGCVNGNVIAKDGLVKIMRNGVVEGNITSRELIVDGNIKGHCQSDSVDIYENGRLDGTLVYIYLSIKKGGVFTGKAEVLTQAPVKQKIVELKSESVTVVPEKCASREKR